MVAVRMRWMQNMTNQEIWEIAFKQSAYDCSCRPEDFLQKENKVVLAGSDNRARAYLPKPLECDLVSYGSNIVASVKAELMEEISDYINSCPAEHCFETPNIYVLNDRLAPYNLKVCFMAEYFLPDMERLKALPCPWPLKLLYPQDFKDLYNGQWSNALCLERKERDVLAVGAYKDGRLIGLAGASADCEEMYQIGIDVLPEFRRNGVASALISRLAVEIAGMGKVPFYCAAWANIKSVRSAIKCGFKPAWAEMTARRPEFINTLYLKQPKGD